MPDSSDDGVSGSQADDAFAGILRQAAHVSATDFEHQQPELPLGSTLGGGRLQVLRQLGRGGMGTVYEVFDAERRERVALKLLSRLGADHVYRLKNEFRALVDVRHPNLVSLHELFAEGPRWYYTMALVRGEPFDRYVRAGGVCSVARLRSCIEQLRAAVAAIHAAGKLHRDLKPSNVLVTDAGKVVVLDFGLSIDAQLGGVGQTITEQMICGTPAYMAPEQAAGRTAEPASDLYAIGVMVFEAITGRLPFVGTSGEIMAAKQRDVPPAPRTLARDVPDDLDEWCSALLARSPSERPVPPLAADGGAQLVSRTLFGRDAELAALRAAYRDACAGRSVLVCIAGESGIGKTALAETFLAELAGESDLTLLSARCYERESVPFKLFDPLIDLLCRKLRRMSGRCAESLVPSDAYALTRLFPVLERVPAFVVPPPNARTTPQALRQRAFPAFGELLRRLRGRGPVVIHLDDLQWSDLDSLQLLQHLLGDRAGVPALLIASHRQERAQAPRLKSVFDAARDHGVVDVRTIALGPLRDADAATLVDALLDATEIGPALREAVVRESGGHPLFAAELSQVVATTLAGTSLDEALLRRIAALPERARHLLELLALTGEPLLARAALSAACASQEDLLWLCRARLARVGTIHGEHGSGKTLECFHDRVRESVSRTLDDDKRRAHARALADVLRSLDDASAELLRRCLIEAGDVAQAAELAQKAASLAERALAFVRAAELWRQALAWSNPDDRALRTSLGEALGRSLGFAGRTVEAAEAYRSAAALATGDAARRLLRAAARELLYAGAYDEGMTLLRGVCRDAGVRLPTNTASALLELAWMRTRLRVRGLALAKRRDVGDLRVLETLQAVVQSISNYEMVPATAASLRYLNAALDAGDPLHACLAFGQAANNYVRSGRDGPDVDAFIARMEEMASGMNEPEIRGFLAFARGSVLFFRKQYLESQRVFREGLAALEQGPSTFMLRDLSSLYLQLCALDLGDYAEIARTSPPTIQEMFVHGRVWFGTVMTGVGITAWLVPDDLEAASRRLDEARRRWRRSNAMHGPEVALHAGDFTLLQYQGRHADALAEVERTLPSIQRTSFGRQDAGTSGLRTLGVCAVALMRSDPAHRHAELRRLAERCVAQIKAPLRGRYADLARPIEVALAVDRGDHEEAVRLLNAPRTTYPPQGAHESARQLVLGELLGGDEGKALVRKGRAALHAQGVRNVDAFLRLLLGFCRPNYAAT